MSRLITETKKIINEYYEEKIKELKKSYNIYKEQYINGKLEEFNNDKNVCEVRRLLNIINNEFECNLSIKLFDYSINYENSNNCKIVLEEINNIKKERAEFLVVLENLPKNSKEYKQAFNKLKSIIGIAGE